MQCPKCWRPIKFEEKYAKVVACPYCNSILEFGTGELTIIGEQWDFIDFPSIFIVWKEVEYEWKKVYVKWQIRYEYDWWFFDKFFVIIDWEEFYIKEDDWLIKMIKGWNFVKNDFTLIDKIAWENIVLDEKQLFIQEVWILKLVNLKWFIKNHLILSLLLINE